MTTTPSQTSVAETAPSSAGGEAEVHKTDVGSVFVSNYPPFSIWSPAALGELDRTLEAAADHPVPLGLYLHIPFCRKRCKFCYFRVYVDKSSDQIQRYLDALGKEIEMLAGCAAIRGRQPRFVYFGGGTPSYIAVKHLRGLVERVQAALPWDAVEELTFECEPGTLTESKVAAYREIGVTRLSLGIESFDDEILRENGRAHVTKEIDRCLPWIRAQGFDQLNVDLIAGMVGEAWESWRDTVARTIDVDPDSVTIYQMELPYNTVYSQGILAGGASPVADWETKRAWHLYAIDKLGEAGYEVSSAYTMVKRRPGREHQSTFAYRDSLWRGADLLGTGVASFGQLAGVHYQNVSSWGEYLDKLEAGALPLGRAYRPTPRERLTRELILQMKLGRLDLGYFRDKFEADPLEIFAGAFERLEDRRMLEVAGDDAVHLTTRGLLQVDALLPEFYDPKYREARYT